jgi:hypothetical protein
VIDARLRHGQHEDQPSATTAPEKARPTKRRRRLSSRPLPTLDRRNGAYGS